MAVTVGVPDDLHRISLDEYHRLAEAGVFEDARVELIDGLILDMSPKSPQHEEAIAWLSDVLHDALDRQRFQVRVGAPLTIAASEPEPDVTVIERAAPRPYHPETAPLVIEVAASSQRRDLVVKPRIYAQAGVPRYWVVDLDARRVVVHTEPAGEAYNSVHVVDAPGALEAPELGLPPIAVGELLVAAAH